jgi:dTDP-L-rhamnose 4-epimerase
MPETILVTGGAGFIGSHTIDALIARGWHVRVLDNLSPQVHGSIRRPLSYINRSVEFFFGDVRDRDLLRDALRGVTVIFHFAAVVGVGQSMYQIHRYVDVNTLGTSILLDLLAREKHSIRRLIVASSMSVYGEGQYVCDGCGSVFPPPRSRPQLTSRAWEMRCPYCQNNLSHVPTPETKPLQPVSIYAISKRDQEEMCICVGRALGIPTIALRYFNAYGPRQSLSNPYTGVVAIFSSRLLSGQSPVIYEDGQQLRDYIHVRDVVQANLLALDNDDVGFEVFNVGTGHPLRIIDVAHALGREIGSGIAPVITQQHRVGDIRHCYPDIRKIRSCLGFQPLVSFEEGITDLVAWLRQQKAVDRFEKASKELKDKKLVY